MLKQRQATLYGVPLQQVLWGILFSLMLVLCFLAAKLHFRSESLQDCARNAEAFKSQLDVAKDHLFLARTESRELDHEKSRLRSELEDVATRLNHVVGLKAQIKTELVKLIDDYLSMKQEMRGMYNQAELTRSEALSLETQGLQVEQQVQILHSSLRALDLPTPSSIRMSKAPGGKA